MNNPQTNSIEHWRRVAEAADRDGREWEWKGGYPQTVIRLGDAVLIANTFEGPDFPSTLAEFIATFDPPTVLALLDRLQPSVDGVTGERDPRPSANDA